ALYSAALGEVPANIRKSLEEIKSAQKQQHKLLEELAEFWAERMVGTSTSVGRFKLVKQVFADRDLAFVKLLAQKASKHSGVMALLGTTQGQAAIVFARSADVDIDV